MFHANFGIDDRTIFDEDVLRCKQLDLHGFRNTDSVDIALVPDHRSVTSHAQPEESGNIQDDQESPTEAVSSSDYYLTG